MDFLTNFFSQEPIESDYPKKSFKKATLENTQEPTLISSASASSKNSSSLGFLQNGLFDVIPFDLLLAYFVFTNVRFCIRYRAYDLAAATMTCHLILFSLSRFVYPHLLHLPYDPITICFGMISVAAIAQTIAHKSEEYIPPPWDFDKLWIRSDKYWQTWVEEATHGETAKKVKRAIEPLILYSLIPVFMFIELLASPRNFLNMCLIFHAKLNNISGKNYSFSQKILQLCEEEASKPAPIVRREEFNGTYGNRIQEIVNSQESLKKQMLLQVDSIVALFSEQKKD